jgi:hypothetical protein
MPSSATQYWRNFQLSALDQLEQAHSALEGSGPGRRFRTSQINGAYIVLLASQFQMFCRNLHSEAAAAMASVIAGAQLRDAVIAGMTQGRWLDRGNADPRNIGRDFARLKMAFWVQVDGLDKRNPARRARLQQLNIWRNGFAHQDFDFSVQEQNAISGTKPTMPYVRIWRRACDNLVNEFDSAVAGHVTTLTGTPPWV